MWLQVVRKARGRRAADVHILTQPGCKDTRSGDILERGSVSLLMDVKTDPQHVEFVVIFPVFPISNPGKGISTQVAEFPVIFDAKAKNNLKGPVSSTYRNLRAQSGREN